MNSNETFRDKIERLVIDFGDFIRVSQSINTRNHHRIFRKHTMKLRESLKDLRRSSLEAEKKMNDILDKAKKDIVENEIV